MKCLQCQSDNISVKDSRLTSDGIKRKRYCSECKYIFFTIEKYFIKKMIVTKKSGKKEMFNRDKILKSITIKHIHLDELELILKDICISCEKYYTDHINTSQIADIVLSVLKNVNFDIYLHFALNYFKFSCIKTFMKFIKNSKF